MTAASPCLRLPYIQPSQAQKHVTHNEALQRLDAVAQLCVRAFGATVPPTDAAPGDVLDVGAGATGAWAGEEGRLALWDGTGWQFLEPREGWIAWDGVGGGLRVRSGDAWVPATPSLQNLPGLGIGAASDATNRLAVASAATLLNHQGAGHQVKVNKASPPTRQASCSSRTGRVTPRWASPAPSTSRSRSRTGPAGGPPSPPRGPPGS